MITGKKFWTKNIVPETITDFLMGSHDWTICKNLLRTDSKMFRAPWKAGLWRHVSPPKKNGIDEHLCTDNRVRIKCKTVFSLSLVRLNNESQTWATQWSLHWFTSYITWTQLRFKKQIFIFTYNQITRQPILFDCLRSFTSNINTRWVKVI